MEIYEKIVDDLVNKGYCIVSDFLPSSLINSLYEEAKDEESYKSAGMSSSKSTQIDRSKRSDKTRWIDENEGNLSQYLVFFHDLQKHLNKTLYLGLQYYETHFSFYEEGDFYERHLDSFVGEKNRIVTTVFYLNQEWNESDGGALVMYDKEGLEIQRVLPKRGTLVVFLSEKFPHEVQVTHKKRYSIAGWYGMRR